MCHLITLCSLGHYVLIHLTYILSIWGHYHVISPVIMRTALLRWLASLFVSVSLSTVHAGDVTVRRWSLTCWPHDYNGQYVDLYGGFQCTNLYPGLIWAVKISPFGHTVQLWLICLSFPYVCLGKTVHHYRGDQQSDSGNVRQWNNTPLVLPMEFPDNSC